MTFRFGDLCQLIDVLYFDNGLFQLRPEEQQFKNGDAAEITSAFTNMAGVIGAGLPFSSCHSTEHLSGMQRWVGHKPPA